MCINNKYEPCRKKTCLLHMGTAKPQISCASTNIEHVSEDDHFNLSLTWSEPQKTWFFHNRAYIKLARIDGKTCTLSYYRKFIWKPEKLMVIP